MLVRDIHPKIVSDMLGHSQMVRMGGRSDLGPDPLHQITSGLDHHLATIPLTNKLIARVSGRFRLT